MFAGTKNQIPAGWAICDGQGKTRNGYTDPIYEIVYCMARVNHTKLPVIMAEAVTHKTDTVAGRHGHNTIVH
ncbi:phage tail protein, partial [Zooshikella ganghwensis]